jgi:hypothetical protein
MGFAGPLMLGIMMVLFSKGSGANPVPWVISGAAALFLYELDLQTYLILPVSVAIGVISAVVSLHYSRPDRDSSKLKAEKND